MTAKQLLARIEKTEQALQKEHVKNVEAFARVPFGAGMRRVHICRTNYSREDELRRRLKEYKIQLETLKQEANP